MKVLITGASGLLGRPLNKSLIAKGYRVLTTSKNSDTDYNADLSLSREVNKLLDAIKPNIIINLVCLSSVNTCEENVDLAFKLNAVVVENLSKWIYQNDDSVRLVHISTDHVYDQKGINSEENLTLRNVYALSKYCGELAVKSVNGITLRTNFFGHSITDSRTSFSDWLIRSLSKNENITLFNDVFFNPLHMDTLCTMIENVMNTHIQGVFNLGSRIGMSKEAFAIQLAKTLGLPLTSAKSGHVKDLETVRRPKNMMMNCSKFEKTFNIQLPTLVDEINKLTKERRYEKIF